jgi:exodeoxyribonuclease-3
MLSIRFATWNINSVRLRAPLALRLLKEAKLDVLCLQETKCPNDLFPGEAFKEMGYAHQAINGQKGYHGVAILSKLPFRKTRADEYCGKADTRHVCATLECGLEIHSVYVPAGGDIPDPKANDKFAHKLAFLREMNTRFRKARRRRSSPIILVGDLNVAPLENDVWSHKQLLDVVSHTPIETDLFREAKDAFDWIDVTREFVSSKKKIYSWWSYRARDWRQSDRGRRLDHIWVSPGLKGAVTKHSILKDVRDWPRPSDHVPVVASVKV